MAVTAAITVFMFYKELLLILRKVLASKLKQITYHLLQKINVITVKILKFGTPQTIATIVLKIEKFDITLH